MTHPVNPPPASDAAATPRPWSVVISDIHLADAQQPDPKRPLWKRFKHPELFIDDSFGRLLDHLIDEADEPLELVLNGDIFDFDSVVTLPIDDRFPISWLERLRGLSSSERKSTYKMNVILDTHHVWVDALRRFLDAGHRVVFVIGNHDVELHWPAVQETIRVVLGRPEDETQLRFCEWFYISDGDTMIEHGNQYDAYCLCSDPVWPLSKKGGRPVVRIPFGDLAGRLMLNGMGLFNPNVDSSFILPLWGYVRFFFKYVARIQPFLALTWFWSALATLIISVHEGLLPVLKDPHQLEDRIKGIARRSNAEPRVVRALRALHVHPAFYNPISILRELWLDRAVLALVVVWASAQVFAFVNVLIPIRIWWVLVPLLALTPVLVFYARSVHSEVDKLQRQALQAAVQVGSIVNVGRVVLGHTHKEMHLRDYPVEVLNTGSWSPAFHDVECTRPFGRKCFASIRSDGEGAARVSRLMEWQDPGYAPVAQITPAQLAHDPTVQA